MPLSLQEEVEFLVAGDTGGHQGGPARAQAAAAAEDAPLLQGRQLYFAGGCWTQWCHAVLSAMVSVSVLWRRRVRYDTLDPSDVK